MVGGSEEGPEEEAAFAEVVEFPGSAGCGHGGDDSGDNYGKDGSEVLVGEGLDFELSGELLGDVALEAAGGVEGGGGEGGDEDAHDGDGEGGGEAEGFEEVGGSVDEGSDFGGEAGGAAPGGVASLVSIFAGEEVVGLDAVDDFGDAESESGDAGEDDDGGEEAFGEHGAIADELGVGFVLELFGGSSRGDEAVKSRDGSAGDGDEEEGEDEGGSFGIEADGGGGDFEGLFAGSLVEPDEGCGDEAEEDEGEGGDELEGVDVVARLQEEPDGEDGGEVGVS